MKMYGAYFWNIYDFLEVKSTRDGARGGHEAGGAPGPIGLAPDPREPLVRRLMPFFGRKKAIFGKRLGRRFQSNRSYGSPDIKETVPR